MTARTIFTAAAVTWAMLPGLAAGQSADAADANAGGRVATATGAAGVNANDSNVAPEVKRTIRALWADSSEAPEPAGAAQGDSEFLRTLRALQAMQTGSEAPAAGAAGDAAAADTAARTPAGSTATDPGAGDPAGATASGASPGDVGGEGPAGPDGVTWPDERPARTGPPDGGTTNGTAGVAARRTGPADLPDPDELLEAVRRIRGVQVDANARAQLAQVGPLEKVALGELPAPIALADELYRQGKWAPAAALYEAAARRAEPEDPQGAWALYQLGMCYRRFDASRAIGALQRVRAEYPDSVWAKLAEVQQRVIEARRQVDRTARGETGADGSDRGGGI